MDEELLDAVVARLIEGEVSAYMNNDTGEGQVAEWWGEMVKEVLGSLDADKERAVITVLRFIIGNQ